MRKADAAGGAALVLTAAIAVVLGLHGVGHPGPLMAAGGTNALPGSTPAGAGATASSGSPSSSTGSSTSSAASSSSSSSSGKAGGKTTASGLTATTQLLSQSQYASFAVPVYPTRASAASQALDGFALAVKSVPGGLFEVVVTVPGSKQPAYTQKIDPGDRVYFIEGQMSDDGPGSDVDYGDDGVIITNQKGYILQ